MMYDLEMMKNHYSGAEWSSLEGIFICIREYAMIDMEGTRIGDFHDSKERSGFKRKLSSLNSWLGDGFSPLELWVLSGLGGYEYTWGLR